MAKKKKRLFSEEYGTLQQKQYTTRGFCLKLTYGMKYGNRLGGSVVRVRVRVSSINIMSA